MGGNALKNTFTRRYEKEEFEVVTSEVLKELCWDFPIINRLDCIPYYREKETFGDLDIIYSTYNDLPVPVSEIRESFAPKEVIKNGDVISFDYKELQVDIIHVPGSDYTYAHGYFSWNDCGNLIGKICHKFGMKHGHRGLTIPLRDGSNVFDEVIVTKDHDTSLRFLGLDPERFHKGFDTLEEMFQFVASSKYFNPELFAFENMNAVARIRDKKRSTYNSFLEFCKNYTGPVCENFAENKNVYLPMIQDFFPGFKESFHASMQRLAFRQMVRSKFNGHMVSDMTGLLDKQLGGFVKYLREQPEFQDHFIAYFKQEVIDANIMKYFESYNAR